MNLLVEQVAEMLRYDIAANVLRLVIEPSVRTAVVTADPVRVQQVFWADPVRTGLAQGARESTESRWPQRPHPRCHFEIIGPAA